MNPQKACSLAFGLVLFATLGRAADDPETRVLNYIRDHVHPGEPLRITELYNQVLTQPEERKALSKLYSAFFRIPLFVAEYQGRFGKAPTLKTIAEQFDLKNAEEADILLRVMESDPRVPPFLKRDSKTGEITSVAAERILDDARFSQATVPQLGGWDGIPAPAFKLPGIDQPEISSTALRGKIALLYVWFTGCPPCMKQTPELVRLQEDLSAKGFTVVGANADSLLELGYDDRVRARYAEQQKINFPLVSWTRECDRAFGSISIFPTLFLIDSKGVIIQHWVGYTTNQEIRGAIETALTQKQN